MKNKMVFLCCWLFLNTEIVAMGYNENSKNTKMRYEDDNKPNCWVDEVRCKIIKKYTKKYDLCVCAIGDSMPGGIIKDTGVDFAIYQPISKQKARQILVECIQDYVQEVNNKTELRPYLENYPVTENNIDVSLLIYGPDGGDVGYPNIDYVTLLLGFVEYRTRDPEDRYKDARLEKETFAEAV